MKDTNKECCNKCWLEIVPFGVKTPCMTPDCSCHKTEVAEQLNQCDGCQRGNHGTGLSEISCTKDKYSVKLKQDMEKDGDTNTLREEFYNWAMKQGDYIPMVNQMDWWLNKFNQKLEEIKREIKSKSKKVIPNMLQEDELYNERGMDGVKGYNQALGLALQIIKNKKI